MPVIAHKAPTATQPFKLVTNVRVDERSQQKKEQKQKRTLEEERSAEEAREHEEHERKKLRRDLVHKAQPMPQYTVMEVKASKKAATVAESPNVGKHRSMRV